MTVQRLDVAFTSEGRVLRGWLTMPARQGTFPAVVMASGFAGVREGFLGNPFHDVVATAGIAVLLYDHANTGDSDGEPRQELDPILQQRGYKDAITFLSCRDEIDAERIGIWGTSYSGGHVLAVAAHDRRVKAVVSQAMTISGHQNLLRRHSPQDYESLRRRWAQERICRMQDGTSTLVPAFGEGSEPVLYQQGRPPHERTNWRNEITLGSWEMYDEYEPGAFIERIAPTPLLMIIPLGDTITPAEDALAAYERAGDPKRLVTVPGAHYSVYSDQFEVCSGAARDWFTEHLRP